MTIHHANGCFEGCFNDRGGAKRWVCSRLLEDVLAWARRYGVAPRLTDDAKKAQESLLLAKRGKGRR